MSLPLLRLPNGKPRCQTCIEQVADLYEMMAALLAPTQATGTTR